MASGFQIRILQRTAAQGKPCAAACHSDESRRYNLAARFLNSCQRNQFRTAITDITADITNAGRSFNYRQIESSAFAFARALRSSGEFKTGNHVGLCFPNSVEYVVAFYGTMIAGGVVVPLPIYETENKLGQLCELADLDFLACGEDVSRLGNMFSPSAELNGHETDDSAAASQVASLNANSLAMLMFTSGTTGAPKAVMLSHRNLTVNCNSICDYLPISHEDRALAVMPFYHAFGNSVMQTHLLTGASLVVGGDQLFSTDIIEAIQQHGCTSLSAVPEIFDNLASAGWNAEAKRQLKYMSVAGGAMDVSRARVLCKNIDPVPFFIMYGQTEATARLAYVPSEKLKDATNTDDPFDAAAAIGYAIPGVQLEIRNADGDVAEPGCPGMLYAQGDNVMLGYWQDPSASAQTLVAGWLRTGDLAVLRNDGMFQLCGRSSNLVKIQGHRFHPREIEQRLNQALPNFRSIAVDFKFYNKTRMALFVVDHAIDRDEAVTLQELRSVCKRVLPTHMVPQRYKILEGWPLSAAGKVDRLALSQSLSSVETSNERTTKNRVQTTAHVYGD